MEAVGQALMWRASAAATGPLGGLARRPRRGGAAAPGEAYEEHFLLPDERVALLTSRRLLLVLAPGFAACTRPRPQAPRTAARRTCRRGRSAGRWSGGCASFGCIDGA